MKAMYGPAINTLRWKPIVIATATLMAVFSLVRADMALDFIYDGADTTVSWSGTWDLSSTGTFNNTLIESSLNGLYAVGGTFSRATGGIDKPYPWGATTTGYTNLTGDFFGYDASFIYGPGTGFTDATTITGSMEALGTDLETIGFSGSAIIDGGGIISGTLSGSGGTVNWTAKDLTIVPEPVHFSMLGGLFIAATYAWRRFRRS